MENKDNLIVFQTDDGEEVAFYVLEETQISGVPYLLVAKSDEEEAEALILRQSRTLQDSGGETAEEEVIYDVVEDARELEVVSRVFEELLDDCDFVMTEESLDIL